MIKFVQGSIPDKILYAYSDTYDVPKGCRYFANDQGYKNYDNIDNSTITVLPAYAVDNSDQTMVNYAKNWAQRNYYYAHSKKTASVHIIDNKPNSNVRVVGIEYRNADEGKSYKAIIDGYYVDLREDVLIDAIISNGIESDGLIKGKFIWAKVRSKLKLIRFDSELYKSILESSSKKDMMPIKKSNLEVGGIYQDRRNNKAVFLGFVNSIGYRIDYVRFTQSKTTNVFDFEKHKVRKAMLFVEIDWNQKSFDAAKNAKLTIKKSHSFIVKIGNQTIPPNIISHIRNQTIKEMKSDIVDYSKEEPISRIGWRYFSPGARLQEKVALRSEFMHMSKYGDPPVELFDIKKYLIFA